MVSKYLRALFINWTKERGEVEVMIKRFRTAGFLEQPCCTMTTDKDGETVNYTENGSLTHQQ